MPTKRHKMNTKKSTILSMLRNIWIASGESETKYPQFTYIIKTSTYKGIENHLYDEAIAIEKADSAYSTLAALIKIDPVPYMHGSWCRWYHTSSSAREICLISLINKSLKSTDAEIEITVQWDGQYIGKVQKTLEENGITLNTRKLQKLVVYLGGIAAKDAAEGVVKSGVKNSNFQHIT